MGKFSTLHVKAHQTPTVAAATNAENSRLARRSDADYVVTGNLRSGGTGNNGTTISFQLGDAQTGNSVWPTSLEAGPELVSSSAAQDEMVGRAGALVGGFPGAIVSAEYKHAQAKPVGELTSYECIVQGVYALALQSPSVTVKARECLERVTQQEPTNANDGRHFRESCLSRDTGVSDCQKIKPKVSRSGFI
jgi:hypothetical protein